jgi:hypothetical protein
MMVQIEKDAKARDRIRFFHIDFGFVFDERPGFDAPVFAIPNEFRRFVPENHWKQFLLCCCDAFSVLRKHSTIVIRCCQKLLAKNLPGKILGCREYLNKALKLDLSDDQARIFIYNQIEMGTSSYKKDAKNWIHFGAKLIMK